jgi:allantoate deiminase
VFELPSGAGHDGMAMIDIADVAMLFVRCRGGISHHPDEHVETEDADAGARVLLRLIENFRPRDESSIRTSPTTAITPRFRLD